MPDKAAGISWAKQMAEVMGNVLKQLSDAKQTADQAAGPTSTRGAGGGAPAGAGGGGTSSSSGSPTGGGGAAAPAGAPAGAGAGNGQPAGDTATGGPATSAPATAPAGSSAKSFAEAAQKALAEINALASQVKAADDEAKKLVTDGQSAKKQVDAARQQADSAEKSFPPVPKVPAPQGKDPKAQYDSAIQITGNIRKVRQDAGAQASVLYDQQRVAEEAALTLAVAHQGATKNVEKLKKLASQAETAAANAASAASSAASVASESKKKAEQAAKEKSADKDSLQKTAQEDAKHAAVAKDAAAKAQTATEQLAASVKNAETQAQTLEKLKQEAKSATEGLEQKTAGLDAKLQPYDEAIDQAEQQEADCKNKLTEEDAEAILLKRYEALGGDPELRKALADEDKEFETRIDVLRTYMKDWQKDRIRELDESKKELDNLLKSGEAIQEPMKTFYEREEPIAEKVKSEASALGEKLDTEPGKELMHEIEQHTNRINKYKEHYQFNEKVLEKGKAEMETLKKRYEDVDKQYEAFEKFIKETRTELDNELEMENMSLEQKVDFLQRRPKPVRDRVQKRLETELNRLTRMSALDTKLETAEFELKIEKAKADLIDWKPIQDRIAHLSKTPLEDLKKEDPLLATIREEYEKAGGDPALLEKRVAEWKQNVEAAQEADKKRGEDFRARSEKLRDQAKKEAEQLKEHQDELEYLEEELAKKEGRLKELEKKLNPLNPFQDFTPQEIKEFKLLQREVQRLKTDVENYRAYVAASLAAKGNTEKLMEQARQRYEQVVDDERRSLPKPTSEEIHKMPLRAKYTELTGKIPSGGV
jgi:chromosome segregation ATPase